MRVGYRVVVDTEVGEFIGRVSLTPRRREAYTEPYDITRVITQEDERREDANRELAREIRNEARSLRGITASKKSSSSAATFLSTVSTSK